MSVSYCVGCKQKHDCPGWTYTTLESEDEKGNSIELKGWFCEKWIPAKGRSDKDILEYAATPLWQLIGAKPNKEELAMDKKVRKSGLGYSGYRKMEILSSKKRFNSENLKKDLFAGKLKQKTETVKYEKKTLPL